MCVLLRPEDRRKYNMGARTALGGPGADVDAFFNWAYLMLGETLAETQQDPNNPYAFELVTLEEEFENKAWTLKNVMSNN